MMALLKLASLNVRRSISRLRAVVGISYGKGVILYRVVKRDAGLARVEIGRTRLRRPANPSFFTCMGTSLAYIVVPELPLYHDLPSTLGILTFDSDDDSEGDPRSIYSLKWRPEVRARADGGAGGGGGYHGIVASKSTRPGRRRV